MLRTHLPETGRGGASSEMRGGPSKSACRSRLQTAASCAGQESVVVSVVGKGGATLRQVRIKETNASEPLMTCRNVSKRCRKRGLDLCPVISGWRKPADWPTGIRHEGGVTLIQALVRNVGTCRPDAKGAAQVDGLGESQRPMRGTGAETPVVGTKVL